MNETAQEKRPECPQGGHLYPLKVIECDGETDTLECQRCGKQKKVRCNFDEEYS